MKISIAISVFILALAAAFGWHDHERLIVVREAHAKLAAEAAGLGISADPSHPQDSVRLTKLGNRGDKEAEAKLAAKEFIAFAKEMEAIEKKGGPPDEATQKRIMDFLDRIMSLDAGQLKILIAEVKAAPDLKDESRQGLIGFSIMTMANDHPQAALAIFTESSDIFNNNGMGKHVISTALAKWAQDDPTAALEWVRENGTKFPDLVTDETKQSIIKGAAVNDPRAAFKLIGEVGLKDADRERAMADILNTARTPEERTTTLAALREYAATLTDEKARTRADELAMGSLANSMLQEDFDKGTRWLANAKLSPAELEKFAQSLNSESKTGDTGRWIEWLGDKLPPEKSADSIRNMVRNWAQNDYQAAGKWLASAPPGSVRDNAVRSYAETVSRYEPEAAAQWAVTLPPGKDREETLKSIYNNWPKKDDASKAAAEAFAKQHGIQ